MFCSVPQSTFFICLGGLPVCMSVLGCWILERQLWASKGILGIEPGFQGRPVNALNCWPIFPAPLLWFSFLKGYLIHAITCFFSFLYFFNSKQIAVVVAYAFNLNTPEAEADFHLTMWRKLALTFQQPSSSTLLSARITCGHLHTLAHSLIYSGVRSHTVA